MLRNSRQSKGHYECYYFKPWKCHLVSEVWHAYGSPVDLLKLLVEMLLLDIGVQLL